jgi:hypothetical protein
MHKFQDYDSLQQCCSPSDMHGFVILVIMSVSALKHAFILYLSRSFMNDMHSLVHMLWCLSIFTYIFGNANVAKISDYTLSSTGP